MSNVNVKPILFIFILALIVYLQQSWVPGMFPDGHLYMAFGKHAVTKGHWLAPYLSHSTYPEFGDHLPFTFILEGIFFKIFGNSYSSARIFSSIFALITLFSLWRILKVKSEKWAYWSCFLLVVTPPLMKKARFPGLDLPLMCFSFLCFYFLWNFIESPKSKNYIGAGFFWGLALLTKGPIACFIGLGTFLFLIISKKYFLFKNYRLYLIPLVGVLIFSLWPLIMWQQGMFHLVKTYIHSTFVHTASSGRGSELSLFTYWIFLIKQTSLWIILCFFSVRKYLLQKNSFFLFSVLCLLSLIIPLSFFKFKLSHYLIPMYPFLAIVSAYCLSEIRTTKFVFLETKLIPSLICLVGLILLIFPVTIKSRRDPELLKVLEIMKGLDRMPTQWGIIDHAYPFYNIASLMGYDHSAEVFNLSLSQLKQLNHAENIGPDIEMQWKVRLNHKNWAHIISHDKWKNFVGELKNYKAIIKFKKRNLVFLVHRSFFQDDKFIINFD